MAFLMHISLMGLNLFHQQPIKTNYVVNNLEHSSPMIPHFEYGQV